MFHCTGSSFRSSSLAPSPPPPPPPPPPSSATVLVIDLDGGDAVSGSGMEVAIVGVPWDGGTTNRPGARHGPREVLAEGGSDHYPVLTRIRLR